MAWKEVLPMEQRTKFIFDVLRGMEFITQLCRNYEISTKTGYKWINRYKKYGLDGLKERSSRPHNSPNATGWVWRQRIIEEKMKHLAWGPKKIMAILIKDLPGKAPSLSTVGNILMRAGLVKKTKRRTKAVRINTTLTVAKYPNHVWAADYKGWFRTKDGVRCEPLTISDHHSRNIIAVIALPSQRYEGTREAFEAVFKRYGLPDIIRCDNGGPFASKGVGRLSRLSVWWIELGIEPQFIEPGHPEQNGIHERMHLTLKYEATRPPSANLKAQQRRFDEWRKEFNEQRPHEALGMRTPCEKYVKSIKTLKKALKYKFEYPLDYETRMVRSNGEIKWGGKKRFIGEAFKGSLIGLKKMEKGLYRVFLHNFQLGDLYEVDRGGLRPMEKENIITFVSPMSSV